jgi:hypothetical protein
MKESFKPIRITDLEVCIEAHLAEDGGDAGKLRFGKAEIGRDREGVE